MIVRTGSDSPPNMPNVSYSADAKQLLASSKNWIKLLDPKTGHFRVKDKNGSFLPDFDEFAWGPKPGYTEAGPWQYRVEVRSTFRLKYLFQKRPVLVLSAFIATCWSCCSFW